MMPSAFYQQLLVAANSLRTFILSNPIAVGVSVFDAISCVAVISLQLEEAC